MGYSTKDAMDALTTNMTTRFAGSYLRVSTRGQAERGGGADEGFSIPAQREANKKKALTMGAMVIKEFVDRGASAKSADRPELQKMLEYVKENADRIDYVIVHKVDRLARNRGDDVDITRTLREYGVQLVSASESIDDTPAGMLLHGIMSSIAEFYSQNLANEVKKGMGEKVKNGGTPALAPLGYLNIRRVDEKGREERTVILDEERAPLVKLAFTEFATGSWTVADLAEHLAARGLSTRPTPRKASVPVDKKLLNRILKNPYYKGILTYKGVEYAGNHTPLVDSDIWQQVQEVLSSHANGERTREHPHFLKGSLYCRNCGSRMIVTYARSRSGAIYPYFVCAGRHNKTKACKQRSFLIEEVERQVEKIYDAYSLPQDIRLHLESVIKERIREEKDKYNYELGGLRKERESLEHKRKKLLEAHYSDAIPLDLLKEEQQKIAKQLDMIAHEEKACNGTFDAMNAKLRESMDLLEDCGAIYRLADDYIKRMMNQVFFSKLWVEPDGQVTADLAEPFKTIVEPILGDIEACKKAKIRNAGALTDFLPLIANRFSHFLVNGLNKNFLVDHQGLEPRTDRL